MKIVEYICMYIYVHMYVYICIYVCTLCTYITLFPTISLIDRSFLDFNPFPFSSVFELNVVLGVTLSSLAPSDPETDMTSPTDVGVACTGVALGEMDDIIMMSLI